MWLRIAHRLGLTNLSDAEDIKYETTVLTKEHQTPTLGVLRNAREASSATGEPGSPLRQRRPWFNVAALISVIGMFVSFACVLVLGVSWYPMMGVSALVFILLGLM